MQCPGVCSGVANLAGDGGGVGVGKLMGILASVKKDWNERNTSFPVRMHVYDQAWRPGVGCHLTPPCRAHAGVASEGEPASVGPPLCAGSQHCEPPTRFRGEEQPRSTVTWQERVLWHGPGSGSLHQSQAMTSLSATRVRVPIECAAAV